MFVPSKMNYKLQITCWKKNQIISTSYERVIRILKNEKKNVKPVPVFRTGTGFHKNGEPVTGPITNSGSGSGSVRVRFRFRRF